MTFKYSLFIMLAVWLGATGCKKFVEVDPPKTQQVTASVFEDDQSATAALFNIYQSMVINDPTIYKISLYAGLYADELKNYSGAATIQTMYTNSLNASDAVSNTVWTQAYNYIYQANAVYEGCNQATQLSAPVKKQLMAEALFIRAFWHFYLVNLFGNVPVVTTTDYAANAVVTQKDASAVYDQIITDLTAAEADLSADYTDENLHTTSERLRPNQYTAAALLARVYLFKSDYAKAGEQATLVIDNPAYNLVSLDDAFVKNNNEAIWQLAAPTPNLMAINTTEGRGYILTSAPLTYDVQNISTLSPSLLSSFESNDARFEKWVGVYNDGGTDYYFPNKYKIKTASDLSEYSVVLRLAEQYLIRAEAKAQANDLEGSIGDVDVIRQRAGLPLIATINPNISKEDLIAAIQHERRMELFTEWGHRWLDLKRTATANEVMTTEAPEKGGSWNANKIVWPIPLKEIQNNPNLNQNQGYN